MALLFWEGFDRFGSWAEFVQAYPNVYNSWYAYTGGPNILYTTGGRFNGGRIYNDTYAYSSCLHTIPTAPSELYVGKAINVGNDNRIFAVWGTTNNPPTPDVYVGVTAGVMQVFNSSGTLLGTSSAQLYYSVWNFLEVRVKMSSTVSTNDGVVEVWLNNQLVVSNTSCITRYNNASTGYVGTNIGFLYSGAGSQDDTYYLDTTGPAPWNTRLGDIRIASVVPNADAGPNQGIQSTGATHYGVVDEIPPSSTDYITIDSLATGNGEMFGHTSPTSNIGNVLAIAVIVNAAKSDAGYANLKLSIKSGGNTYNSNVFTLSTSAISFKQEWQADPSSNTIWSNTAFQTSNIGFYVA